MKINLNADLAEGWGAYAVGDDRALIGEVKSANVACGLHGGDWNTMHRACQAAKAAGCSVGARPGFNDLWGFGRRMMRMAPNEIERMVAYQIGALSAVAGLAGIGVTHLKPHGALSNAAALDRDVACAIGRAIRAVDRTIIYVAQATTEMERAALELDLPLAREGFCDRQYEDDLQLVPRGLAGAVYRDPLRAAAQASQIALEHCVVTRSGRTARLHVDTICIHGDEPGGVAVAETVRKRLEGAGVVIVTLPEMMHSRRAGGCPGEPGQIEH